MPSHDIDTRSQGAYAQRAVLCCLWLLAACGGSSNASIDMGAVGAPPATRHGSVGQTALSPAEAPAAAGAAGHSAKAAARSPASDASTAPNGAAGTPGSAQSWSSGTMLDNAGAAAMPGMGAMSGVGNAGAASSWGGSGAATMTAGAAGAPAAPAPTAGAGTPAGPEAPGDRSSLGPEPASCTRTQPSAATPVVYVIGDSTASVYTQELYPRMGWAQPLQDYFPAACAEVQDKALSGRSSKSFYDEGAWTPIARQLRAGDFVLIQFGHNDEKRDDASRYADPYGSYQQYLSRYIDDTLASGATPILLTSIERNKWNAGKLASTHGDYPEAVRQLAQTRAVRLVDMTTITHDYLENIGEGAATKLFMNLSPGESPNYPSGNSDNTHLQERGAHAVAELALAELARQRAPIAALLAQLPTP